jgi:hypothetical protein
VIKTDKYPPACPHDPITEMFAGVYLAHGSIRIGPGIRINRNMIVVREGHELTLINPIRLNAGELKKLDRMGTVKHVLRLGDFHGADDPFYVDTYRAEFWCQPGQSTYALPKPDHVVDAASVPPMKNAEFFLFENARFPEAALLLKEHALLVTTDSLQYLPDWSYTTPLARIAMRLMGFRLGLLIGKPWLKRVSPRGGSMEADFDKLLRLDFDNLVSAHGSLLRGGAKARVRELVGEVFAPRGRP